MCPESVLEVPYTLYPTPIPFTSSRGNLPNSRYMYRDSRTGLYTVVRVSARARVGQLRSDELCLVLLLLGQLRPEDRYRRAA